MKKVLETAEGNGNIRTIIGSKIDQSCNAAVQEAGELVAVISPPQLVVTMLADAWYLWQ